MPVSSCCDINKNADKISEAFYFNRNGTPQLCLLRSVYVETFSPLSFVTDINVTSVPTL